MSDEIVAPIQSQFDEALVNQIAQETIDKAGMFQRSALAGYGGALAVNIKPNAGMERDFQRVFSHTAPRSYWDTINGMEAADAVAFQQAIAVRIYRERMMSYGGGR